MSEQTNETEYKKSIDELHSITEKIIDVLKEVDLGIVESQFVLRRALDYLNYESIRHHLFDERS